LVIKQVNPEYSYPGRVNSLLNKVGGSETKTPRSPQDGSGGKSGPFVIEAPFGLSYELGTIFYKGLEVSSKLAGLESWRNNDDDFLVSFLATSIAMYCKTRSCQTSDVVAVCSPVLCRF
jgi:hypothetical protein